MELCNRVTVTLPTTGNSVATKLGFPRFAKYKTRRNFFQFHEISKFHEMDLDEISRNFVKFRLKSFREIL
jgi:hypothetical protein